MLDENASLRESLQHNHDQLDAADAHAHEVDAEHKLVCAALTEQYLTVAR
jgi:hypothetical protein